MTVRALLVNRYETLGDEMLGELAAAHGDRLCLKVRLSDAIDVDEPGFCTKRELTYALRAHLDFVFVDEETSKPRFAVELDGSQHRADETTLRRDAMKDDLCDRAGLPLLRVANRHIGQKGENPILSRIAETYYLSAIFDQGQECGVVPLDEPYHWSAFPSYRPVDAEARQALRDAYEGQRIASWIPNWVTWRVPEERAVASMVWVQATETRWVQAEVKIRDFSFNGIVPSEIAEALATLELAEQVRRWIAGEAVGLDAKRMQPVWDRANRLIKQRELMLTSGGTSGAV